MKISKSSHPSTKYNGFCAHISFVLRIDNMFHVILNRPIAHKNA